jgi:hypothetical protein
MTPQNFKGSERQISRSALEQARGISALFLARIRMAVDEITSAHQQVSNTGFQQIRVSYCPLNTYICPIICGVYGDRDTLSRYRPSHRVMLLV